MRMLGYLFLIAFLGSTYPIEAGDTPNGAKCAKSSDCASGYCFPGPAAGTNFCLRADLNCAMEGVNGHYFGFIDQSQNPPAICAAKIGWLSNPTVDYDPADFLLDSFRIRAKIHPVQLDEALSNCAKDEECSSAVATASPKAAAALQAFDTIRTIAHTIAPPVAFRAAHRTGGPPVREGLPFAGEERKYHFNIPNGFAICSIALKTIGVTPQGGKAALMDMTFSASSASIYTWAKRNGFTGGGTGWEGEFFVVYVRKDRVGHYRSLKLCDVTDTPKNFLCRGNGVEAITQDDPKSRTFVPCGNHNLADDARY
ncbi:hypothetical protein BDE40_2976 [Litoreibacter halocynthiae]|uniref:CEL-III C-terminal domain-containing protein n=1 Tax=Litoreibacter halocynthiae TaxID=1242689 RepID=A0A4R7LEW4_9RHOB|nr:hypothetical protein [Litoreibacter halocynthiae]TDT74188.1 hypothetical protein BDE40_2976 [Litoreibacter halocynthiae]